MSKQYNVKVALPDGSEQMNTFEAGKVLRLKAMPQGKYQLIDAQTGMAPDVIKARRVGKDLHIDIVDSDEATLDLVIEDYYDMADGSSVVGQAENGLLYDYTPQMAVNGAEMTALSGEQAIAYVLGETTVASGAAVGVLGFNPLLAGLGAAGAAAAAGGGGGGGGADTTAPAAPIVDKTSNNYAEGVLQSTTLTGRAEANSVVLVRAPAPGSQIINSVTVDANGNYQIVITPALEEGAVYTVTARDAANNVSTPTEVTGDVVPPVAPVVTEVVNQFNSANQPTGTEVKGRIPEEGREPGMTVYVYGPNGPIASAAVNPDGTYTVLVQPAIPTGTTYEVFARDAFNNPSEQSVPVTGDTTPPESASASLNPVAIDDTGISALDGVTSNKKPTIVGQTEAGTKVEVTVGGKTYTTSADANGNFRVNVDQDLSDGEQGIKIKVTDNHGNSSTFDGIGFVVDATAPSVPTDVVIEDNVGQKTGPILNGDSTDDSVPVIKGKAAMGVEYVNVYNKGVLIGTATVNKNNQEWSYEPSESLPSGEYQWQVSAVDLAGNESDKTPVVSFVVVVDAPDAPAISDVFDNVGAVTGPVAKDATTDDRQLDVRGTGLPDSTIRVFADGAEVGSAKVGKDGRWSVTTSDLPTGVVNITAVQTTPTNQVSPETGAYRVVVDIDAPSKPTFTATDDVGPNKGAISAGATTDDATPTFAGTGATPGDTMTLREGNKVLGTATVGADGTWSITPTEALGEGSRTLGVIASDPAGNQSPAETITFNVDTTGQPVAITKAVDNTAPVEGDIAHNGVTNDRTPTLEGTGRPGATVTINEDGAKVGEATVLANGTWSFTAPSKDTDGPRNFSATAPNAQGTSTTSNFTLTLDTTAPAKPTGFEVRDDVGAVQGLLKDGDATDDTTPTFSGAGATPSDVIKVYENNTVMGSAVVKPDGTWSVTISPLSEGPHALTVTQTDKAGNESPRSDAFDVVVDTTAPTAPTNIQITDNVGELKGVISNNGQTDDNTPTISGKAPADTEFVKIYNGNEVIGTATVAANGDWSFTPTVALTGQAYAWSAAAVDAVGNESPKSTVTNFTLVTEAPGAPAISEVLDNFGVKTGMVAKDDSTDDRTLEVRGSGVAGNRIDVFANGVLVGNTTVTEAGTWSMTTTQLPTGVVKLTAKQVNTAVGLVSPETGAYRVVVDIDAPSKPTFTVTDDVGPNKGAISAGATTDDATPTFAGTGATPGDTMTLREGNKVLGTATVGADGTWSITPTEALGEGSRTLGVIASDPAGNQSPAETITFNVDTTEQPVAITKAVDNTAPVEGDIAHNGVTNDRTPTLEGTGRPGATVTINEDGAKVGEATVLANGTWSFTAPTKPTDGPRNFTATAPNAKGESTTSNFTLTLDTTAPAKPTGFEVRDDVGAVQGLLKDGDATDDTTPTFSGVGATPGDTIKLYDGPTVVGSTQVKPDGTWSVTTSPLSEGPHALTVTQTDKAGNESDRSDPFDVVVDTTAPTVPTGIEITDNVGPETEPIVNNGKTDDSTPTISGKAPAGTEFVNIYNGNEVIGTATVDEDGDWSFTPEAALLPQAYAWSAAGVDAAGNEGPKSAATNFTVVPDAPEAAAITTVVDNTGAVQGVVAKGGSTDDRTLEVRGTGKAGNVVRVFAGNDEVGSGTVNADGVWSVTTSQLPVGVNNLTARLFEGGVQNGPDTGAYRVVVDVDAPSTPVFTVTDDVGPEKQAITSGATTDDATPTFAGTGANPGDTITLRDGDEVLGTAIVAANGSWSITPSEPLEEGTHDLSVTASDPAGNPSTPAAFEVTVDTKGQPVAITNAVDDTPQQVGDIANNGVTNDRTPTLEGTGRPGATVTINEGSTQLGTTTVGSDGTWSFTAPSKATDGPRNFTATAPNAKGESTTSNFTLTLDTTAPAKPSGFEVRDDVGAVQGLLKDGDATDDTTPTFSGVGATPGDTIKLYDGPTVVGSAQVKPDGTWSVTASPLSDGPHALTLTQTDKAGNESPRSDAFDVVVDTTAPNKTASVSEVDDNVGIVTGPVANPGVTDDTNLVVKGSITAALADGESVRVYDGKTFLGTATINAGSTTAWTFNDPRTLTDGQVVNYVARVSDPLRNESPEGTPYQVTVDLSAPNKTAAVTAINDNEGSIKGIVANGGVTDDTSLNVTGTLTATLATGERVRVYDGSTFLGTATITGNGTTWSFDDTRVLTNAQTVKYTARVADAAGNRSAAGTEYTATVDRSAPNNDSTTLTIDNITADNILNPAEITGNINVTGTVTGDFTANDKITLRVNGTDFSSTVDAEGKFTVAVTATALRDNKPLTVQGTLVATDRAGLTGNVTANKSYSLNQPPVDGDETLSATEGTAFTAVDLKANATDSDSDALTVNVNSTTGAFRGLVTVAADGKLSIDTANTSLNSLKAGATSTVEVNYTVSDGRGGSDTSKATIIFTGVNDAPSTTASISNNASLYSIRGSTPLNITDIDQSAASGGPLNNRVPTGWSRLGNTTPDLNDYDNNAWKGQFGIPFFYVQSNVNGRSNDGGEFIGLVFSDEAKSSEGVVTAMSGLTIGTIYTVAVQWQQAVLTTPADSPDGVKKEGYYGGQLQIFTTGDGNVARVYTSSGVTDGWQTALYTFTARGTTQNITLKIDDGRGTDTTGANYTGGYIVVDSLASSVFETDTYNRSSGTTLSTLFPSSNVTDVDDNSSLRGYAVTSAANGSTGGWEYSTDNGTNWFSMATASVTNAFYLAGNDRVRYTGLRSSNTKLDLVLVDDTGPALHGAGLQATTINVTTRGGTTAFSADVVTLAANAAPVLLDLDGDGRISYSVIDGDINVDGLADKANWVAGNDGILFHDKFGDGQLHSMDQFAFAQYGGDTDLEGLAIGFDSNKDGVFDARDAAFDAFQVWQDLNQDGKVDGGELNSLLSLGITSIALNSDGAERNPVAGVTEHGQAQATLANGGSMLVVDASLDYQHGADLQAQADQLKAASVI